MGIRMRKPIIINRELSELDKFVLNVVELIGKYAPYVIVSGYVTILFGRSRGTEDVDFVIERVSEEGFLKMCDEARLRGFEFLNPEDCGGLYEMLLQRMGIRMARQGEIIPNAEIKFPKDYFHREALEKRIPVELSGRRIYISPIELQIAYKLYLGSDKDFEDAFFLYELFKEELDWVMLREYAKRLNVEVSF
ncbi:hypothetical protein [Thermococcus thioreducens]|uniref:Nucleotidyltransferase n=1 Tax=Thermococcus thioreducens TaxID=277988 RepID=A0A0Q2RDW8_9EURY|nr:hypothetical protein [Thermococcus thioreducens]ASJ11822.1 hypothetical protein A3L14_02465 [Thermococcus thioreducens]KQH82158.1 hypothetical protein AMR53_07405 [Thermococcus thioreducens]SEW13197.1 hypothetical protein SAMN05216170_1786 [Thermococcus thioreducens]